MNTEEEIVKSNPRDLAEEELIKEANLIGVELEGGSILQTLKEMCVSFLKSLKTIKITSLEEKDFPITPTNPIL